jgi:hypothetical protein
MIHVHIPYPSVLASLVFLACLHSCRDKEDVKGNAERRAAQATQQAMSSDGDAPGKAPIATRSSSRPTTVTKQSREEIHAKNKELIFSITLAPGASKDREDVWKALEYPEHGTLSFAQEDDAVRVLAKYEAADDTTRLLFGWLVMQRLSPPDNRPIGMLGDGSRFAMVNRKAVAMICKTLGVIPDSAYDGRFFPGIEDLCPAYLRAHTSHSAPVKR